MQSQTDKSANPQCNELVISESELSRRDFIAASSSVVAAASMAGIGGMASDQIAELQKTGVLETSAGRDHPLELNINNQQYSVSTDPRTTLLDLLREQLQMTGTKKGAKGIGEIGIVGVAAAIANAVFNATGKRIRDLPITPEKVMR